MISQHHYSEMTGFEVYQQYILIKTHFSDETFDATKYNKTSGKPSTYNKRNDRKMFEFLALKISDKDMKPFFISNFVNHDQYIVDIIDDLDGSIKTFQDWKRKMSQLTYIFEKECRSIKSFMEESDIMFDDLFKTHKDKYPIVMRLMMEEFISFETYILFEKLFTLSTRYDIMYNNADHIYDSYALRIKKYTYYFKSIDLPAYKKIMRNIFDDK